MGESKPKKFSLEIIDKKIDRLSQLHELTSIETILVTIWIAAIVLGITLFVTVDDILWKIVALILIMINLMPIVIYFSQFLSDAEYRFFNFKLILIIISLYLISLSITIIFVYTLVTLNIKSDAIPLFVLLILESWGLFIFLWDTRFEKNLNNKFSYFLIDIKTENRYVLRLSKFINFISTKGFILLVISIIFALALWSIFLNEIIQLVLILFVGIVDIFYIFYRRKFKRINKIGKNESKEKSLDNNKEKQNQKTQENNDNSKQGNGKNLLFIQTIATLITVLLMFGSIYLANNTVEISKEATQYNKEIVDWYKNPKPFLSHSSKPSFSYEDNIGLNFQAINNYDPEIGIKNNPYIKQSINISLYNSGRAPLKNARVKLYFEIYDWNPDKFPTFPFKILVFSTPYESFWFKQNSSNYSQNKIIYQDEPFNRYVNNFGAIDFPPTINYSSNQLELNYPIPRLYIGSLGIEKETWIYVQLFAIHKEASGYLILEVTGSNISPYILKIPIASR